MLLVVESCLFRLDDEEELGMKICMRVKPLENGVWGRQWSTTSDKKWCPENKES